MAGTRHVSEATRSNDQALSSFYYIKNLERYGGHKACLRSHEEQRSSFVIVLLYQELGAVWRAQGMSPKPRGATIKLCHRSTISRTWSGMAGTRHVSEATRSNDQALSSFYYIKNLERYGGQEPILLDHESRTFECMHQRMEGKDYSIADDGTFSNTHTASRPCMLHFNGPK